MLKAVLDTNVIISGLNFSGSPAQVLELVAKGAIQNVISQGILDEVQGVLVKKFSWGKDMAQDAIEWLRLVSEIVDPQEKISAVAHEPDNRIIECAISGNATLIVSGDKKHLQPLKEFQGILIVGPNEFLNIFLRQDQP
ncbi:MAG: putative toxin-antitoxin system toxin component, PIN family [Desulfobacterales bacterium]|jgi:putative PIN family toxin of toxin-antitoxin system